MSPTRVLIRCTACQAILWGRIVWLEMDTQTGTYHAEGEVDPDRSQGAFPFGVACAGSTMRNGGRPR